MALAKEGALLVLAARTKSQLDQVADRVAGTSRKPLVVPTDVADPASIKTLFQKAISEFGTVDILVNAAGVYGPIGPSWEVGPEEWFQAIRVNLYGTFLCCQEAIPHMIQRRKGKIVNFSGGGATAPLPRFSAYAVSKSAVVRLTETLAEELKAFNVQVNAVAPGAVDTKLQDEVMAAGERAGDLYARIQIMRESGEGGVPPDLAASLVTFLASDAADGLTGRLIAAPYDGWQRWDRERIEKIMAKPWFTLRRIDEHTIRPFVQDITGS